MPFFENIVLFIPMGMSLQGYKKNTGFTMVNALIISVLIESLQYVFSCGKTEMDDVMANTIGALIGCCIVSLRPKAKSWKIAFGLKERE